MGKTKQEVQVPVEQSLFEAADSVATETPEELATTHIFMKRRARRTGIITTSHSPDFDINRFVD